MMNDRGSDGYRGNLNRNCVTIAEPVKTAGYSTYISGKWHVTRHISPDGPKFNWPCQRGFDKSWLAGNEKAAVPTLVCCGQTGARQGDWRCEYALGSGEAVKWDRREEELVLTTPERKVYDMAVVFEIILTH